jgi:hypothetical protein
MLLHIYTQIDEFDAVLIEIPHNQNSSQFEIPLYTCYMMGIVHR